MPLFDLKCALNQPKMVQNTWNLHQSIISMSSFRKYEQKFIPVKNLAAATHFPLKIPWIPFIKGVGEIPFSTESRKKLQLSHNCYRGLKFVMNHPNKYPQKVTFTCLDTLRGCHFIEGNSPKKKDKRGKTEGISLKWQPLKI